MGAKIPLFQKGAATFPIPGWEIAPKGGEKSGIKNHRQQFPTFYLILTEPIFLERAKRALSSLIASLSRISFFFFSCLQDPLFPLREDDGLRMQQLIISLMRAAELFAAPPSRSRETKKRIQTFHKNLFEAQIRGKKIPKRDNPEEK